jgi:hypothetical protein
MIINNVYVHCDRAFSIDARGLSWAKGVGVCATKELIDLSYKKPPWSLKYPELLGIPEDEPLAPQGQRRGAQHLLGRLLLLLLLL